MIKYLFLDLYGVLVLDGYQANDDYGALFDAASVDNLAHIIEQTQAKIVITSSYRSMGMDWLHDLWKHRSMPFEIYSATPILERTQYEVVDAEHIGSVYRIPEYYAKGLEIERWLNTNAEGRYQYAILDDESYFLLGQAPHFVQTNPDFGITDSVVSQVIDILNK